MGQRRNIQRSVIRRAARCVGVQSAGRTAGGRWHGAGFKALDLGEGADLQGITTERRPVSLMANYRFPAGACFTHGYSAQKSHNRISGLIVAHEF